MIALRLADVWFAYDGAPVLRGVSLDVREGEAVALLGRNGVGKTTLTRLVMALLRPARGAVWVGDKSTEGRAPEEVARRAAYVFQRPDEQLFARTVWAEVAFGPRRLGVSEDDVRLVVADALRRVGLEPLADAHPYDLPPARRKLVALAAALAQRPRLLVLDEPTQGLDRKGRAVVEDAVRGLTGAGIAVLAVTHDLRFASEALARAIVLADGRIAYDGRLDDLLRDAARLAALGLEVPPTVELSRTLALPGLPIRVAEVARALRARMATAGKEKRE